MIRDARCAGQDLIEPYHDRIREAVAGRRRGGPPSGTHLAGLRCGAGGGGLADPEKLRGRPSISRPRKTRSWAARYYALGGDQAAETLAFDHAARLYGLALDLGSWTGASGGLHAPRGDWRSPTPAAGPSRPRPI